MYTKIKTFEDACDKLAIPYNLFEISIPNLFKSNKVAISVAKLMMISNALNDGWQPNWQDEYQEKFFPVFFFETDGEIYQTYLSCFFFIYEGYKTYYKSAEIAMYAGRQFRKLYIESAGFNNKDLTAELLLKKSKRERFRSCDHPCSPSDFCKDGMCDKNGCYY